MATSWGALCDKKTKTAGLSKCFESQNCWLMHACWPQEPAAISKRGRPYIQRPPPPARAMAASCRPAWAGAQLSAPSIGPIPLIASAGVIMWCRYSPGVPLVAVRTICSSAAHVPTTRVSALQATRSQPAVPWQKQGRQCTGGSIQQLLQLPRESSLTAADHDKHEEAEQHGALVDKGLLLRRHAHPVSKAPRSPTRRSAGN